MAANNVVMTDSGGSGGSGNTGGTAQQVIKPGEEIAFGSVTYRPRLSEPSFQDKQWIKKGYGGYNLSIIPNPVKGQTFKPSNLPNCVGYAWGRAYEISTMYNTAVPRAAFNNPPPTLRKNLNKWAIGNYPRLGAMVIWRKKGTIDKGHISVVEQVLYSSSGKIEACVVSESGYPTSDNRWGNPPKYKRWNSTKLYASKNWVSNPKYEFMAFMYPPYCALFSKDAGEAYAGGYSDANGYCGLSVMTVYILNPETGQYEPAQGTGNTTYTPELPGFPDEPEPAPKPSHNAGNKVKIKGIGNSNKLGTGKEVTCLGAVYQIKSIHIGFPYMYRVGDDKHGIGYFKEEDLEKV